VKQEEKSAGRFADCSEQVIGACIEVHRELGPGLLESAYEQCLAYELSQRQLAFEQQIQVPVRYKGVALEWGYRVDFLVAHALVVEIKAVERLLPVHEAQVITHLRLLGTRTGLLVNFHAETLRRGIRRLSLRSPSVAVDPTRLPRG
jgi:GxxExxY protein